MKDKKGIAALLVADMGKKQPMDGEIEESGENEGMEACAEEMMAALDSKDVKGFMSALNAFIDQR